MSSPLESASPLRVVLLHAYSRFNAGDGLLVDEAAELVRRVFPGARLDLVAMDPESFPEFPDAMNPVSGPHPGMTPPRLVRTLITGRPHPAVTRLIDEADLAVAVGGGYLRAGDCVGLMKTVLSQLSQAPRRGSGTPYVYLPQSIGPFPFPRLPLGLHRLQRASAVFVRDNRSLVDASRFGIEAQRLPDMAALALLGEGRTPPRSGVAGGRVAVVGRTLGKDARLYDRNLGEVIRRLGAEVVVQSQGRGNDDPSYYRSRGLSGPWRTLVESLADPAASPPAVVSVRLHGSLQSILAGVPSVHLSYERKGWGAYEDLGLSEFVHNARRFDPELVIAQARQLVEDPSAYWDSVERAIPGLSQARSRLEQRLLAAVTR